MVNLQNIAKTSGGNNTSSNSNAIVVASLTSDEHVRALIQRDVTKIQERRHNYNAMCSVLKIPIKYTRRVFYNYSYTS